MTLDELRLLARDRERNVPAWAALALVESLGKDAAELTKIIAPHIDPASQPGAVIERCAAVCDAYAVELETRRDQFYSVTGHQVAAAEIAQRIRRLAT